MANPHLHLTITTPERVVYEGDVQSVTVPTIDGEIGVLPHHIEACLNHKSGSKAGVAGIYNHAQYAAAMRDAFDRWARYVEGIVSDKPNNVLAMVARQ